MTVLSDSPRLRRLSAGLGLIGFPLAGLFSSVLGSNEGTETPGPELYAIMEASDTMLASGLVFMISALLTIPAACGMLHLTRARGAVLGHLGAALLALGALGHMGYATWQVMLSQVPHEPDRAALVAYLDRSSVVTVVLLPMLIALPIGLLLMIIGLRRAGRIAAWMLWLTVALIAADLVVNSVELDTKLVPLMVWAFASIAVAPIALTVLRMPDSTWTLGDQAQSRARSTPFCHSA